MKSKIYQNKLEAASVCVHNRSTSCEVPSPFRDLLFPVTSSVTQPSDSRIINRNVLFVYNI